MNRSRKRMTLLIDGSHGEGGGQILRTSVALSAVTGQAIRIENIRKGRPKPGMAAQHLASVRAAGAVCSAEIIGGEIGSRTLTFLPQTPPQAGNYSFDVAAIRMGGSAGTLTLILQTLFLPLVFSEGKSSTVHLRGGTHIKMSPSYDYLQEVWLWTLRKMGVHAELELLRTGWFPAGEGEIQAIISSKGLQGTLDPFVCPDKGKLQFVSGRALTANLPAHISQRMAQQALDRLSEQGVEAEIHAEMTRATTGGAGIFLTAEYENLRAGFGGMGVRGKPAEKVANEAVDALIAHRKTPGALDLHLGDQLILPAALASGPSAFSTEKITRHLITHAWVVEQFGLAEIQIEGKENHTGSVRIIPRAAAIPKAA